MMLQKCLNNDIFEFERAQCPGSIIIGIVRRPVLISFPCLLCNLTQLRLSIRITMKISGLPHAHTTQAQFDMN